MGYIIDIGTRRTPKYIGNKAFNLRRLSQIGMLIPQTYVVSWEAHQRYLQDDARLVEELRQQLLRHLNPEHLYAIRSSANLEDSFDRSFAGQFKSVLDVKGVDAVFQAIWSIWGTARSPRVESYLEKHSLSPEALAMGVIIQDMITPVYGGVALSRNPVTGADEVVIEAVEGSGDALVQSGVTPHRWIHKWENWIVQPKATSIPLALVEQIAAETRLIARRFKAHVDLEWVYDGRQLYWLQVREITTLNQHNVYSNHISKEMVPGMIKPLIASVNIPLVCGMWVRLLTEILGKTSVQPCDLAKPFYYRVYFNMGTLGRIFEEIGLPADSVETLMGLFPDSVRKPSMRPTLKTFLLLPRLMVFLYQKWHFASQMRKALPQIEAGFRSFAYAKADSLSDGELLKEIDRLFDVVQEAAYYNIVGPLLMMMYNRVLKGQLARQGLEFSQFDLMAGVAELQEYAPSIHLHKLHEEFARLNPAVQETIRSSSYAEFLAIPGIETFQGQVSQFLAQFDYLSDNGNDFSTMPWREMPETLLDLIINFTPASEDSCSKTQLADLNLRGMARLKFLFFYRRAREFHLLRERIGAAYNFGYGLFRYYYLALGAHFVQHGWIDEPADIFFLQSAEIRQLINAGPPVEGVRQLIARHKTDIKRFENIALPTVIYGDQPPPVEDAALEKLVGVPTSIGHYTGKVSVVRGIRDFNKVQQGDVLIIPYSDVGWTPLFARAGAVVAESGGMLSHSSIIAREYNIPAIVSVAEATRLPDRSIVTVNGHTGEVLIHSQPTNEEIT